MTQFGRSDAVRLIKDQALSYREEPFKVVSGESHWYIDVKQALQGQNLLRIGELAIRTAHEKLGVTFNVVGGPTMGADPISFAIALAAQNLPDNPFDCSFFSVRKEIEEEKRAQTIPPESPPRFPPGTPEEWFWLEYYPPKEGDRVLWVEDAISTGASVEKAMQRFREHPTARHAEIVGALAVVDRGEHAKALFARLGFPYDALVTYRDLDIPHIGQG